MMRAAGLSSEQAGSAGNETSTPGFERVLSAFETAPDGKPFDLADVQMLNGLQLASKEHYSRILDAMLEGGKVAEAPPPALVRGAQMLHRRIANAFAEAATRLVPRPQLAEEQVRIAELALCSLRARADEIKWHAFEQTVPQNASWQQTHELMAAIESLGMERRPLSGGSTCTDAFAQCLLIATLNVGILTAPQMELAHRWLSASARSMRVEPFFDPEAHWYQVDLARASGPERVSPAAMAAETTRFVAVAQLGPKLGEARSQLYAGSLSVGATPTRVAALHFGAFLDLAERLWSPDWRRNNWRSERDKVDGETIEVVLGFERVLAALGDENGDSDASTPEATWPLRDRSSTGLGALLTRDAGARVALGALVAFRACAQADWELGTIVRRIRAEEDKQWIIGIKRLSNAPIAIELEASCETLQLETDAAPDAQAIYAPISTDSGRIDGIVIDAKRFDSGSEYRLSTGGGAFRIRANRVIDRGEQWVRIGFEVLGKQ